MGGSRLSSSRAASTAAAFALAALVAWLDFLIKSEISLAILYLAPVSFAAWFGGRRAGLAVSLFCALVWLADETIWEPHRYLLPAAPYVNAATRFAVFALLAALLDRFHVALDRERAGSKFKTDMLSLVTHEFNNALTISSLALSVLKEGEPEPGAQRAGLYSTLQAQNRSLKRAVTNFLSFARMESGRLELRLKATPPGGLVDETLSLLAPLIQEKGLRIERGVEKPPEVRADPDALGLVLTNLVGNAVKFTPPRGLVSVRALPTPDSKAVRFIVEDAGVGMTEEQVERIRTRSNAAEPLKREGGGFGLGLRLSQDILQSLGSELRVESRRGLGTRYTFELPVWA